MKKPQFLIAFAAFAISLLVVAPGRSSALAMDPVTYQAFYDALSPYGKWLYDVNYGYVWTPNEGNKFRPYYTNGYWAMTDAGCTWISNYPWGWAPFHYGRWVNDALYHWIWVPGNKWAPAWVVWRLNGDYVGWTPITPGTSITAAVASTYYVPADWWVIIKKQNLLKKDFQRNTEPAKSNNDHIRTMSVNMNKHTGEKEDETYLSGPRAVEYSKSTGQNVKVYTISAAKNPGKAAIVSGDISLYKPVVEGSSKGEAQPAKYVNAEHPIGKTAALSATGSVSNQPASKKATTKSKSK